MTLVKLPGFPNPSIPWLNEFVYDSGYHIELHADGFWYGDNFDAIMLICNRFLNGPDELRYVKVDLLKQLAVVYQNKIDAGYLHSDGNVYQLGPNKAGTTGIQDLTDIAAMVNNGTWPSAGGFIRDMNNVNQPKDGPGALAVSKGASSYVLSLRAKMWNLKDTINAAGNKAGLPDITQGWPG